jgi:eukaryotic-like serine/threonine-protein kinase
VPDDESDDAGGSTLVPPSPPNPAAVATVPGPGVVARPRGNQPAPKRAPTADADTLPAPAAALPDTQPASGTQPTGDGRLGPGQTLGRYEIEELIGRGGMGEVYAAYDPNLDRPVAVKVLLAGVHGDAQSLRLVREAQALARLQHPNVVAVYDAGEDRGHVFLAMQFVQGETLAQHLRGPARPWKQVLRLFLDAGRGLAAAHAAGIIHRDFKPSNVLVDANGHVAVTDFGLARQASEPDSQPGGDPATRSRSGRARARPLASDGTPASDASRSISGRTRARASAGFVGTAGTNDLTRVGEMMGTPAYMPSEQMAGAEITAATDQFAFSVSVWEALFRAHPYAPPDCDGSPLAYATALEAGVVRIPERHAVPRAVVAALIRGLERDPAKRWPSMAALLAVLERAVRPRRWPLVAAAGVVLAGGGVALALGLRSSDPPACAAVAKDRAASVWSPAKADAITARFVAASPSDGAALAATARTGIDTYVTSWTAAATDACTANRGTEAAARERSDRELACLDRYRDALGRAVAGLGTLATADSVASAWASVASLPPVAGCKQDDRLQPPPAIAGRVDDAMARVRYAQTLRAAGLTRDATTLFEALRLDTADLDWEPYQLRLRYEIAANELELGHLAGTTMREISQAARALGMHQLELDAATMVLKFAASPKDVDDALAMATAAAVDLHDPQATLAVAVYNGWGLARIRRFPEAASLCRDARATAEARHWVALHDDATDCLVQALVPMGQWTELEPIVDARLARAGDGQSSQAELALYLSVKAQVMETRGKFAEAEPLYTRVLEIRKRAFGESSLQVAGALRALAGVASALEDIDKSIALLEQALAIADAAVPPPRSELSQIHRDLGMNAMTAQRYDDVKKHFALAIEHAAALGGAEAIEVAYLELMYGQYQTRWDLDAGLATLHHAIATFEKLGDPRVSVAAGALGMTFYRIGRYREAIEVLDKASVNVTRHETEPMLIAQIEDVLARCLVEVGEKQHARTHAESALGYYATAGDAAQRESLRDWIADEKLPPFESWAAIKARGGKVPPIHAPP